MLLPTALAPYLSASSAALPPRMVPFEGPPPPLHSFGRARLGETITSLIPPWALLRIACARAELEAGCDQPLLRRDLAWLYPWLGKDGGQN